ncbi:VOC family protein [Nonomuraea sp. NPDC023979]|uniref:VOC family protein n=1 Tax=Nonomuraea sp. NPDC023979 TaxID=3154796 RepID=UPI0033EE4AF4
MGDVNGLHHVGHIVRDMDEAMERYRRLGFTVAEPAYPVLPGMAEPVGVVNTHVYFPGGFVELVSAGRVPAGARPIPLRVPDDKLPGLTAAVRATAANIAAFLRRFQGLHIVIADTPDIDAVAARVTAAGVGHGGVHAVQRPVETATGTRMEPARYLELSHPGLPPGRVPEGRVGFAQNAPVDDERHPEHANGATALTGCLLHVAAPDLAEVRRRYATYFGPATQATAPDSAQDSAQAAAPDRAGVTVTSAPQSGGAPPALPGFAGFTVSVRDLDATVRHLGGNGVAFTRTGRQAAVPVLGTTIVFRQEAG